MSKLKGPKGDAPPHVLLPRPIGNTGGNLPHGQNAGFLGKTYDPFVLNADPSEPDFAVRDLLSPDYLPPMRVDGRESMRKLVDRAVSHLESVPDARLLDSNFQSAYRMMSSETARAAFNLSEEDDKTKDRYGRNRFGMSCLLARRMIERGVRFVTVNMFETVFNEITWDIHGSAPFSPISCYRDLVGPMFDHAYSSLLEDLHDRGLLQDTLVLASGEFGRTPKVNPAGGRDHWTNCWTMVMARRRDQGRAGRRGVRRDRRRIRATVRSRRPMSPPPSTRRSASTSRRRSPARPTVRSRSSTTATTRSRSCSDASGSRHAVIDALRAAARASCFCRPRAVRRGRPRRIRPASWSILPERTVLRGQGARQQLLIERASTARFVGDRTPTTRPSRHPIPNVATVDESGRRHRGRRRPRDHDARRPAGAALHGGRGRGRVGAVSR